jgi:hypothetical protein
MTWGMIFVVLHMSHDSSDAASLSWGREQTSLILGGFLGMTTGVKIGFEAGRAVNSSGNNNISEDKSKSQ